MITTTLFSLFVFSLGYILGKSVTKNRFYSKLATIKWSYDEGMNQNLIRLLIDDFRGGE